MCGMAVYLFKIFVITCLPICPKRVVFQDSTCLANAGTEVFSHSVLCFGRGSLVGFGNAIGVRLAVACTETDIFITVKCPRK